MRIVRSPWALALTPLSLLALSACSDTNPTNPTTPDPSLAVVGSISIPVISNLSVASGKTYVVGSTGMAVGSKLFVDRSYAAKSPLPSEVAGAAYIMAADNDKAASPGSSTFLSFDVDRDVTVYIAHDARVAVPSWLSSSFQDIGVAFYATDAYSWGEKRELYKKTFPKGRVTLGSNVPSSYSVAGNMYTVMIVSSSTSTGSTDTSAPSVSISSPSASATVSGTITVTASASDNVKVASVQFQVDGKAVGSADTASPYSISWNTTSVADGSHTITAVATDASGNTKSASVQVTVKNSTSSGTHAGWYVSPNGSSSGSGSSSSPWSLATALAGGNGKVHPGDTVWLRGGRYGPATFHATMSGTASAPIIVRQYPGERATVDGTISADGSYTWFWGFEITNSNTGSADVMGVDSHCPGCRFINLVIHDHSGNGIGMWSEGPNQEAYGNIIYNNGFHGSTSSSYGHGIYAQNNTGTKRLIDNLLFNQFGYGVHIYGSDAAYLNNFTVDGNVVVNSGRGSGMDYQIGGGSPVVNLTFTHNMNYRQSNDRYNIARLGYTWGPLSSGAVVTDNYFVGQVMLSHWSSLTFQRNTVIEPNGSVITLELMDGQSMTTGPVGSNTYDKNTSGAQFALVDGSGGHGYTLSGWQSATGLDGGSSLSTALPTSTRVLVQPNAYERGRANVIIYNWGHVGSVSVDLSNVLNVGDAYEVRNAQNYYGTVVASGTYNGGSISLPITSITPPASITGRAATGTGTEFNAYVIVKK